MGCVEIERCIMGTRIMFSISTIEEKVYEFFFGDEKVLFMYKGSISHTIMDIGVRHSETMRVMDNNNRVIKNRE
jgi:hypothetical protein